MNDVAPHRVTVVFAGLVTATCAAWWLGSESSFTAGGLRVAATLTILIAFAKVYFIAGEFMELRCAPTMLRTAFNLWVGIVAVAAVALVVV